MSNDMIPQVVIWIMSGACNLRCIHCYASRFVETEELSLDGKLKLIDELAEYGVSYIGITGGEPLLNKDLEPCLRRIWEHGIECGINTSAQLLDEEKARIISKYDSYLFVSLDGACRRIYELIRGLGSWDCLMRGLETARRAELEFSTVMAVNKLNYMDAAGCVELAEKAGADSVCMIPTMPVGRAGLDIAPSPDQLISALRAGELAAKNLGCWINVWCYVPGRLVIDPRFISTWSDCRRCRVLDVDPAGNLLLCDILDIRLGNVRKEFRSGLSEYFESREVKEVMRSSPKGPCKSCELAEICMGGCYARSYLAYGTFDGPDPYCPCASMSRRSEAIGRAEKS